MRRLSSKYLARKIVSITLGVIYNNAPFLIHSFLSPSSSRIFLRAYGRKVRLRGNFTTKENDEEILRQPKDAALKFRGCFQAVCELPRSVPHRRGRRGWVSQKGGVVRGRQGVVVLEPTYRASKWPSVFLPFLSFPPSLCSFLRPSRSVNPPSIPLSLSSTLTFFFVLSTSHSPFAFLTDYENERLPPRCPFDRFIETHTYVHTYIHIHTGSFSRSHICIIYFHCPKTSRIVGNG